MGTWKPIVEGDDFIRRALAVADPLTLRVLLAQWGDAAAESVQLRRVPGPMYGEVPVIADAQSDAAIRESALGRLSQYRDTLEALPEPPEGKSELHRLVEIAACASVPARDLDLWLEELALDPTPPSLDWSDIPAEMRGDFKVLVIGAGLSGILVGIHLKRAGIAFEILDRNPGVGGTWYRTSYPGARVDIPSSLYSYAFGVDYPWRHHFATHDEIRLFIEHCVDKYGLRDHLRLNTEVLAAAWQDEEAEWHVRVSDQAGHEETMTAGGLVSAVGMFGNAKMPTLAGLDDFKGPLVLTASWDHSVDLSGKRVGMIGTGCSGMQLAPDLAPEVERLIIFQRTPGWVVPVPGYRSALSEYEVWLRDAIPYYRNWARLRMAFAFGDATALPLFEIDPEWTGGSRSVSAVNQQMVERLDSYMRGKLADRSDLIEMCTPDYPPMANRPVMDNGWFDALHRKNVELVADPIERILENGVRLASGVEIEFDVLVLATGYETLPIQPMNVVGRDGLALKDFWAKDGGRAYLGMMMPGFPNLWMFYGPNSQPKAMTPVQISEMSSRLLLSCIRAMISVGARKFEVRADVFDDYQRQLDDGLRQGIWLDPRVSSYYVNEHGRVPVFMPWGSLEYWRRTAAPDPDEYIFE